MVDNTDAIPDTQYVMSLSRGSRDTQDQTMLESRHASKFLSKLRQFRDEKILCDVVLHVSETKLYVHKIVLAAWSLRFSNLILPSGPCVSELTVGYDNVEAFCDFVEFLYSGIIIPTENNVCSLLDIGKNFHVESLVNLCEGFLNNTLTAGNVVSRYFTSQTYDLPILSESVFNFVESNISSVGNEISLLNLPAGKFKRFLSCGQRNGMSQEVMFSFVINWVGYMLPERENLLLDLLSDISWTHTVNDLLVQISDDKNIFTTSQFCLFQLLHCIVLKVGCDLGPYTATYPHLYFLFSSHLEKLIHPNVPEVDEVKDEGMIIPVSVKHESEHHSEQAGNSFEVNTNLEHTSFSKCQKITQTEMKQVVNEAIPVDHQVAGTTANSNSDTPDDLCETHCDVNDEMEIREAVSEEKILVSRHRRKNVPKKVRRNGKQRETRSRGCTKKTERIERGIENKSDEFIYEKEKSNAEYGNEDDYNAFKEIKIEVQDVTPTFNGSGKRDNPDFEIPTSSVHLIKSGDSVGNSRKRKHSQKLSSVLPKSKSNISNPKVPEVHPKRQGSKQTPKQQSTVAKEAPCFPCSYENCDFVASQKAKLDMHVDCVHVLNVTLTCHYCEYTTALMGDMCLHMKTHFTTVPYMCDVEGCKRVFQQISHLIPHLMSHRNERPYKCDLCSKTFCTYSQVCCHKNLHKDKQFECDVCHQRFTTKSQMQQHRGTHFSDKPYLCDWCGFATRHQSHLSLHRKTHTGNLIRCIFAGCNYTTPKRSAMNYHMDAHLDIRNHVCQVCGKTFVAKAKLLRHERIHLKEKLFKCKQCEYRTSRTDRMKLHLEQHGIKIPKRKYNLLAVEEQDHNAQVDFSHLYERVQPGSVTSDSASQQPSELAGGLDQKTALSMDTMGDT